MLRQVSVLPADRVDPNCEPHASEPVPKKSESADQNHQHNTRVLCKVVHLSGDSSNAEETDDFERGEERCRGGVRVRLVDIGFYIVEYKVNYVVREAA